MFEIDQARQKTRFFSGRGAASGEALSVGPGGARGASHKRDTPYVREGGESGGICRGQAMTGNRDPSRRSKPSCTDSRHSQDVKRWDKVDEKDAKMRAEWGKRVRNVDVAGAQWGVVPIGV